MKYYVEQPEVFRHNDLCSKTAFHATAEPKHLRFSVSFRAPPQTTGTIKLKSLIKVGPANTGQFYWPAEVTLSESTSATVASQWFESSIVGESCDAVCSSNKLLCDEKTMIANDNAISLQKNVVPNILCK
jgi:hypothetical protein